MKNGIKTKVLSIVIASVLVLGTMAYTIPLSANAAGGTVSISVSDDTLKGITYNGYKVFDTEFKDNDAKNITWSSDEMKTAVEGAIRSFNTSYTGATAFDALDYIIGHIASTTSTTPSGTVDNTTILENRSLGNLVAIAIENAGLTVNCRVDDTTNASELDNGWYLFVTDKTTLNQGDAISQTATAPAFVKVKEGETTNIVPKTTVPTLVKEVKEDSTGEWGTKTDADRFQMIDYRLTGFVPANIASYDTYRYIFEDTIGAGLTPCAAADIVVSHKDKTNGDIITIPSSEYTTQSTDDIVKVEFADVKKYAGEDIIVEYQAWINENASPGTSVGKANVSAAVIRYSNNPHAVNDLSVSQIQATEAYTYELDLHKVASDYLDLNLSGVEFTVQDVDGKYIKADGSKSDEVVKHTTDDNGLLSVKGIDAGVYTVKEIKAHNGYVDLRSPITVTVNSEVETPDTATGLMCAVDDANDALVSMDGLDAVNGEDGTMKVLVKNEPMLLGLPITGAEGILIAATISGLLVAGALIVLIRREVRKAKNITA